MHHRSARPAAPARARRAQKALCALSLSALFLASMLFGTPASTPAVLAEDASAPVTVTHGSGKSMFNYQRTLSTSPGSGLDVTGANNGSAVLEVTVDGRVVDGAARTVASAEFYQAFALRGLASGRHDVQIEVRSGTLVVDAVAVVG